MMTGWSLSIVQKSKMRTFPPRNCTCTAWRPFILLCFQLRFAFWDLDYTSKACYWYHPNRITTNVNLRSFCNWILETRYRKLKIASLIKHWKYRWHAVTIRQQYLCGARFSYLKAKKSPKTSLSVKDKELSFTFNRRCLVVSALTSNDDTFILYLFKTLRTEGSVRAPKNYRPNCPRRGSFEWLPRRSYREEKKNIVF